MKEAVLPPIERERGQAAATNANMFTGAIIYIFTGGLMMLYATDVLGFSAKQIALVISLDPLISLLRFPLIKQIERYGRVRTIVTAQYVRGASILAILLIPASWLNFPLFLAIILLFTAAHNLGFGSTWPALLRDITSDKDRGNFFSRMRFRLTLVQTVLLWAIPFFVGESLTEMQYKAIVLLGFLGTACMVYYVRKIPELPQHKVSPDAEEGPVWRRLWQMAKASPLVGRPLLISGLIQVSVVTIMVVYLKRMLMIPSNLISFYISFSVLGALLSFLLWGKITDVVGYRPMLIGLRALWIVRLPLLLLVPAFPEGMSVSTMTPEHWLGLVALLLFGFFGGAEGSGTGLANTNMTFAHVKNHDAMEMLNLYNLMLRILAAGASLFYGFYLDEIAIPRGIISEGFIHFDWVKGLFIFVLFPLNALLVWQATKLRNSCSHTGVADFFSSITLTGMRSLAVQRHIYHEDADHRCNTARWLGSHPGPLGIDPLLEMLTDPSYDVRVEAVRSLARTNSMLAGEKLLELLQDEQKNQLHDHIAWALGELKYAPAFDALVERLNAPHPRRVRAMAARALGKLGDPRAIPALLAAMQAEDISEHILSSLAAALIILDARNEAGILFNILRDLKESEPRYELVEGLCGFLGIPSSWHIRYTVRAANFEALAEYVARRPEAWLAPRKAIIDALTEKNHALVQSLLKQEVEKEPWRHDQLVQKMNQSLTHSEGFDALCVLACAWMLLQED